jgi:dipeptidyl-peptidase-3
VIRECDNDIMKFDFSSAEDGKDTFTVRFDRSKLRTIGFKALCDFLHKLHVYKSIGDFKAAEKFFNHYS